MIQVLATDVDRTEATRIGNLSTVKANGTTDAVIEIQQVAESNAYKGGSTYNLYHLKKISICPEEAITTTYTFTVDVTFDGINYFEFKKVTAATAVVPFVPNMLDWYGYVSQHPIRITIESDDESIYNVHLVYEETN